MVSLLATDQRNIIDGSKASQDWCGCEIGPVIIREPRVYLDRSQLPNLESLVNTR